MRLLRLNLLQLILPWSLEAGKQIGYRENIHSSSVLRFIVILYVNYYLKSRSSHSPSRTAWRYLPHLMKDPERSFTDIVIPFRPQVLVLMGGNDIRTP